MRRSRRRVRIDSTEERRRIDHPQVVSRKPRFDGTITLGNVITAIAIVITLLTGFKDFSDKFAAIETKVDAMWIDYTIIHNYKGTKQ